MSSASAIATIQAFASRSGNAAFPNLGLSRALFAQALIDRIRLPNLMDQGSASLCGPAVFLFAVLRKNPNVFAKYVIDLYETGQGKIGGLVVSPGIDCRSYRPAATAIAAVDWVALASLRDSSNLFSDYQTHTNEAAGITLPGTLAGWFSAAGFSQVENRTNLVFDSDLLTLLKAGQLYTSGAYVCLFIGANLLSGQPSGDAFPDHWVALTSAVQIDGAPTTHLISLGEKLKYDNAVAGKPVSFNVYTWGDASRSVTKYRAGLKVKNLLSYFYGYVAAK
jgi:hypothetical protein